MSKPISKNYPVAIGKLLEHPILKQIPIQPTTLLRLCREEAERQRIEGVPENSLEIALQNVIQKAKALFQLGYPKVLNGTGIILHTGLGRARLSEKAIDAIKNATQYCLLEINQDTGLRGDRWQTIEKKITYLLGCESALITNNCASAVLLVLTALANKKEVIVSRSELVEIGGSFRMPDVISAAGVKRIEVGTTNRVRITDYENAITPKTAAILKVHPSNYRITGFTEAPNIIELKQLCLRYNLPLIEDLGNGLLLNLEEYGLPHEPTVQESLQNGVDVLMVSGDKCFGGPQAGIILGKSEFIQKCRKHPILRAVRPCKLTLSALDATVTLWLQNQIQEIPFVKQLSYTKDELQVRAMKLLQELEIHKYQISIEECEGYIGSGAVPLQSIADFAITIDPKKRNVNLIARKLREQNPPVFSVVKNDKVYIHLRTIDPSDDQILLLTLKSILSNGQQ